MTKANTWSVLRELWLAHRGEDLPPAPTACGWEQRTARPVKRDPASMQGYIQDKSAAPGQAAADTAGDVEERAAILEFEGGLSRADADALAARGEAVG